MKVTVALVLATVASGTAGDVNCGQHRAQNCHACVLSDDKSKCAGECRWSRSMKRCLKPKERASKPSLDPGPSLAAGRPPSVSTRNGFLLVAFIEQQLASATSLGLHQVLRTAHALGRTAVLPRARFDEPSYRTTLQEGYFPIVNFYDRDDLFGPWKQCTKTTSYVNFLKDAKELKKAGRIKHEIDLIVQLEPKMTRADSVQRSCNPDLLRAINNASRLDAFRRGVSKVDKVLDTFGGVVSVGDIVCVSRDATADQLKRALGGARSVVLMTPDDRFLSTPWHQVCSGIPDNVRFKPRIAKEWETLGAKLTAERYGKNNFACIHIRMEKLVRQAYLAKLITWEWNGNTSVDSPYLDRCIRDMQLVISNSLKKPDRPITKQLLLTDMQSEFGSVTEHVDTKSDLLAYRAWLPTAESRVRRAGGAGFCGTKQHRDLVSAEERQPKGGPSGMLLQNPRACAWAEATMCRRAPVIMRFGAGSFSNFATAERGMRLESCDAIAAQAAIIRGQ